MRKFFFLIAFTGLTIFSTVKAQKLLTTTFGAIPESLLDSSKTDVAVKMTTILELLSEQISPDTSILKIKSYNALSDQNGIIFYILLENKADIIGLTFYSNHRAYSNSWQDANWIKIEIHQKWQHEDESSTWNYGYFFDEMFYDIGTDGYCDGYRDTRDTESNFINPKAVKPIEKFFMQNGWVNAFDKTKCFDSKNDKYANRIYAETLRVLFLAYEKYF